MRTTTKKKDPPLNKPNPPPGLASRFSLLHGPTHSANSIPQPSFHATDIQANWNSRASQVKGLPANNTTSKPNGAKLSSPQSRMDPTSRKVSIDLAPFNPTAGANSDMEDFEDDIEMNEFAEHSEQFSPPRHQVGTTKNSFLGEHGLKKMGNFSTKKA
mmetsp:Transcript_36627/g.56192  ORF Transcript_36627/g.56192 Transcript_36627/m.56192 type:complete len:158 (+) Transcript_36627:1-474(+)